MNLNPNLKNENLEIKASIGEDGDDDFDQKYNKSNINTNSNSKSKTPVLDSFSKDITKMVEEGKIDPIVGRNKEIQRVSTILSRRKKNNPIIIGEPGCVDGDTIITVRKVSDDTLHENIEIDY